MSHLRNKSALFFSSNYVTYCNTSKNIFKVIIVTYSNAAFSCNNICIVTIVIYINAVSNVDNVCIIIEVIYVLSYHGSTKFYIGYTLVMSKTAYTL